MVGRRAMAGVALAMVGVFVAALVALVSLTAAAVGQSRPPSPTGGGSTAGPYGSGAASPAAPLGPSPDGADVPPDIPPAMATLYQQAGATCPGLPWTVLAGIGTAESDNGQSTLPGVHSGANAAGAEGPMQFEPATFAAYDRPVPPGGVTPPSPYDPVDAVYAAARMLCADGARHGQDLAGAVYAYNHSQAYVAEVFALAASLGGP